MFDVDLMGVVGGVCGLCDVSSAWYCISMVGGMVVAMVDCDGLTMVSWRAVVSFRARVGPYCRPSLPAGAAAAAPSASATAAPS